MPLAAIALLVCQNGLLPAFPSGWTAVPPGPPAFAEGTLRIPPSGPGGFTATGAWLLNPPVERDLAFTVKLRRAEAGTVEINAFAYDASMKLLKPSSVTVPLQGGQWTEGRSVVVAPPGTAKLSLWVINASASPLEVRSPEIALGGYHVTDVSGGGLLRASAGMTVRGRGGAVIFPIPGPTAETSPVSFVLRAVPPTALKGYVVRRREGENWVCEAQVTPSAGGTASLRWESLLAVRDAPETPLPRKAIEAPVAVRGYLAATPVVQADDPQIKAKARELRADGSDVEAFVRRTIAFTSRNEGTGKPFLSLDAATALGCGGSCTSRANLAAALLRAGGVPARTVSHLPTFANGSPLYEHWLVEYWHPGVGWTRAETTLGEFRPKASGFAALATASIEDERETGRPGQAGWIMPGAAWMSGIQGSGTLTPVDDMTNATANWCRPERRLPVDEALLTSARLAWPRLAQGHPELDVKAMSVSSGDLLAALRKIAG